MGRPEDDGLVVVGLWMWLTAHGRSYSNTALRLVCRCIGTSNKVVRDRNRKQHTIHLDQDEKTSCCFNLRYLSYRLIGGSHCIPPWRYPSSKIKPPQRLAPKSVSTS
jgi:hypothetical protein